MPFNNEIRAVYTALQEINSLPINIHEYIYDETYNNPITIKEGISDGIVLKSDTFIELGGPLAGSLTMVLQTNNEHLVTQDKVTLIGNDISNQASSIAFGQIILLSGESLTEKDYLEIANIHNLNGYFDGYMVKVNENHIWVRISHMLAEEGFSFSHYGNAIIEIIKKRTPTVKHVEIIFITFDKEHFKPFLGIVENVKNIHQTIKENKWLTKGINIYDCAFHGNCSGCSENSTCNEIRKIAKQLK